MGYVEKNLVDFGWIWVRDFLDLDKLAKPTWYHRRRQASSWQETYHDAPAPCNYDIRRVEVLQSIQMLIHTHPFKIGHLELRFVNLYWLCLK